MREIEVFTLVSSESIPVRTLGSFDPFNLVL